jgi:hypothetical protein
MALHSDFFSDFFTLQSEAVTGSDGSTAFILTNMCQAKVRLFVRNFISLHTL